MSPDITVVVPVYRNRRTLGELRDRLRAVLQARELDHEVLFVDDACPEGSSAVLSELARDDRQVRVLTHACNQGQHRAVLYGLSQAQGRYAVIMDADLQDPPEAVPLLLDKLALGYAAVFAGRRGMYESRSRLFTSFLFKRLLSLVTGLPPDAGMFVAIDRRMIRHLVEFKTRLPFVVAMIGCSGLPMASIPVARALRSEGKSAYSSWRRLKTGCLAILLASYWKVSHRPLGGEGEGAWPGEAERALAEDN